MYIAGMMWEKTDAMRIRRQLSPVQIAQKQLENV